jgi:hypothetical protein
MTLPPTAGAARAAEGDVGELVVRVRHAVTEHHPQPSLAAGRVHHYAYNPYRSYWSYHRERYGL